MSQEAKEMVGVFLAGGAFAVWCLWMMLGPLMQF